MPVTRHLLSAAAILAGLGIPVAVFSTALGLADLGLAEARNLACAGIGLAWLAGGIIVLEVASRSEANTRAGVNQETSPSGVTLDPPTAEALVLQAITFVLFALILDFRVRLQACFYAWLGYAAGVLLVLARRRKALTKGDWLYIRWAWVPIIVIGVPLFIRVWKAKGLISPW